MEAPKPAARRSSHFAPAAAVWVVAAVLLACPARAQREDAPLTDHSSARLLFAPTARTHDAGQLALGSQELFFPYATLGIGGRLDLRAGVSILPYTVQFLYGGAKIGLLQGERASVAVGALSTTTTNVFSEDRKDEYGGVAYAVGTFGSSDAAVTVGAGYLATGGAVVERALVLLGGEWRLGHSNVKLLSENYLLFRSGKETKTLFGDELFGGDLNSLFALGVRLVEPRTSVDVGAVTSPRWWDENLPVAPLVTFSYSIGHRRAAGGVR